MKTKIVWRLKSTAVLLTFIGVMLFAPSSSAQPTTPDSSQRGVELINGTSSGTAPAKSQHLDADSARRFAKLSPSLARASQPRQLSLADRVVYQRAIEEVYWRHLIWPKGRPDPSLCSTK